MKQLLSAIPVFALMMISTMAIAQKNYPVLTNPTITNVEGGLIDPNGLPESGQVRFNIMILNLDEQQTIKSGSCDIKIDLGEKLVLPEGYAVAKAALSEYINWSVVKDKNGNVCLLGKLLHDLPAGFEGTAFFSLQCKGTGRSLIKTNLVYDVEKLNNNGLNAVAFTIIPKAGGNAKN